MFNGLACLTLYCLDVYLVEFLHEELAVLSVHNCLNRRSEYAHTVFLKYSATVEFHAAIECCLSSKSQQYAVRTFLLNYFLHEIWLYGEEIDLIGNAFRCLHCGDVRIDKYCLNTLLTQGFQCLRSGVVELSCLSYLQCSRTEEQYLLYIVVFHFSIFFIQVFIVFSIHYRYSIVRPNYL